MTNYYLIWAVGPDRPGLVASITEVLFRKKCNLEDSSMMRLGSEFGVMLIFTTKEPLSESELEAAFKFQQKGLRLQVGVKKISRSLAHFKRPEGIPVMIRLYGYDKPGLVYKVTGALAESRFNITDLTTHRTLKAGNAGYILLIEGEVRSPNSLRRIETQMARLAKRLGVKITTEKIGGEPF